MAADLETRAIRMITGQAGVLHLRMGLSRPEHDPDSGMLFRRNVEVPPDADLHGLLSKWNPGVPPDTLEDLMSSVCRWNQLKNAGAAKPGLKLVIPSVLPHGKEPVTARPALDRPRPAQPPAVSPKLAVGQSMLEQRLRAQAAQQSPQAKNQIWVTQGQSGPGLAGANVKQHLQGSVWQHRPAPTPPRPKT